MPVTRAEAERLFNRAWHLARNARLPDGRRYRDEPGELASRIYRDLPAESRIEFNNTLAAARRAINAIEAGQALENDPTNRQAVLNRNYPLNPGIDRRRGEFEYRVIVVGTGSGSNFETLVFVRSRTKLSGEEIIYHAERDFQSNQNLHRNYAGRIGSLGATPTLQSYIMSATRNPG